MATILILALPTPLRRLFEYLPPDGPAGQQPFRPGQRIGVPFGRQTLVGILVSVADHATYPIEKLRHAHQVLDTQPLLSGEILRLCQWTADYYHHSLGEVLHTALPVQLRRATNPAGASERRWRHTTEGKGLPHTALSRSKKQQKLHQLLLQHNSVNNEQLKEQGITQAVARAMQAKGLIEHFVASVENEVKHSASMPILAQQGQTLNEEQQEALSQLRHHQFTGYLLEGTTGSGKTEVYLQAIARTLQAGKQALVLVPEIGLTPQTLARFKERFQVPIVQLHSNVSEVQRTNNWIQAASGHARIVIGTRLAVFTPMPDLGIIVLDEEHDLSFKQQDGLRYSARDLAVVRASRLNIPLLMGSATPSLESLHNAISGRYQHLHLTKRAGDAQPPHLQLLDMRKESVVDGLAQTSLTAIRETLQRGEQVLVFINRRGFAPALTCHQCGWTANCTACDARMTLHSQPRHLRCHHCDQQRPVPRQCPTCRHPDLSPVGQGTERCEESLRQMLPEIPTIRVDQDSMQRKNAMVELTKKLHSGEPCLLVGTQMLAKGHHFPLVTLVVLVDVDQGLLSGDFRGPERMGQQIIQVAGRSGRADRTGRVIIQSYNPEHPLLQLLLAQGYSPFARTILSERQSARLPPHWYMAVLRAESKRADNAMAFLKLAQSRARQLCPPSPANQYLGPIPSLLERRNDRWRFQLQISFANRSALQGLLKPLLQELEQHALSRRTRWSIDVDPLDMA